MRRIFVIICVLISTLSFSQDKVELLNKGNEYFQEGDFEKAEEYYKESFKIQACIFSLGRVYSQLTYLLSTTRIQKILLV